MSVWLRVALCLSVCLARPFHDGQKKKHGHTYLQFCADDTTVTSHACVHKVDAMWPEPAVLAAPDCKEAATPHAAVGTSVSDCTPGAVANKNIYDPITIQLPGDGHVDSLTDWDRIRCRDGQLFNTGWYKKYTPAECARLCAKINNFYGKKCTHFSRQWIQSRLPEHNDGYGRDGETIGAPYFGEHHSAGTGSGSYTYRGQCIFFNSANEDCCATKSKWLLPALAASHCTDAYGAAEDGWNSKHRSWKETTSSFTPGPAWPVSSLGRRLSETRPFNATGEESHIHELIFPDGVKYWAVEETAETDVAIQLNTSRNGTQANLS